MLKIVKVSVFIAVILCVVFLVLYNTDNVFLFNRRRIKFVDSNFTKDTGFSKTLQRDSHVLFTKGCKVPKFDPFDPVVVEYYASVRGDIICKGKKYLRIENNMVIQDDSTIQQDFHNQNFKCTYKPIYRNPANATSNADKIIGYGAESVLNFNKTLTEEFVKVTCRVKDKIVYEDFLASTPIKSAVENRCSQESSKVRNEDALNVIIVGVDSVSKLNFERHFKQTAAYIRHNLSTFEFHGYMKVADNTFPNLTPVLTGHFISRYYNQTNRWRYFDDLDFIWKNYSSMGYRTLYAEDAPDMGTYNYVKNGFQHPPTDYYFRPFTVAIEDTPWQKASNTDCFQANPEIVVLFNYLRSFLTTMENRRYFAFTWAARLTHGVLNKAGYADKPVFELLKDINDMGLLNRSALVFMSDHGIRFGKIRKTFVGKIEERMPFLFMSFPTWFLEANPEIKSHLIANQNRLTTPFDLHETLVDLYQMASGDQSYIRTPYGISLFRHISPERNCESAYILPHWCVCHEYRQLKVKDHMTLEGAEALVTEVNSITMPLRNMCEELKLSAVLDARVSIPTEDLLKYNQLESGDDEGSITYGKKSDSFETLLITVKTEPGGAEFESTLRKIKNHYKVYDISRINKYGNQSECVNDSHLRKYCYCK